MTTTTAWSSYADALAMPTGFCLLEKRFVDVTLRYGVHPFTVDRWKKICSSRRSLRKKRAVPFMSFCRASLKTVSARRKAMCDEAEDFLETAHPDALRQIARARELTREYYFSAYSDTRRRSEILRELLGGIGDNVMIDTPFHCDYGKNIFLGNNVVINMNCTLVDNVPIRIGSQVLIASNVQIYTASHPVLPQERLVTGWKKGKGTFFRTYALPIEIEDQVWIGGGSILLPGVRIGKGCVIGAGSVVTHSVPAGCVAVGSPCRVIRRF